MQTIKIPAVLVALSSVLLMYGCVAEQDYKQLKVQNARQSELITQLKSELAAAELELDRAKRQLADARNLGGIETKALEDKVAALENALKQKQALIARMQEQLLAGMVLPPELSTMLEDFAKGQDMVTFDPVRGIVKFKSDLLFQRGSDVVASDAVTTVKGLCDIMNSDQAKEFDVIIAGHTDDIPIGRPETRAKHPTNWHLSAHRAIAVLNVMAGNGIDPTRVSIRGFGEYRPVVPNKPNKAGNPQNRRVEIYIVPKGM
jgi:chemotaxis protein MotB